MHANDFLHRDIKPENILVRVGSMGSITALKVGDLGCSCAISEMQAPKLQGTHGYMAPEMLLQRDVCGKSIDVWSLGVVLYNLVTGEMPYKGNNKKIT